MFGSDWPIALLCETVAPAFLSTLDRGEDQTFTPLATEPPVLLTMFTPVAPFSALPAREVESVLLVVTVELAVAMFPVPVCPAVTLLIWSSLMGCALVV
jgi:hypothetical protein